MRKLFAYDRLTGLPKGKSFVNRLKRYFEKENRDDIKGAVFYIDIDNFQVINDIYGYTFGDRVIRQIAHRLRGCGDNDIGDHDEIIARAVSDEFLIFYPGIEDEETACELAHRLLEKFDRPIVYENNKFYISLSIGIALYPTHGNEVESVVRHANMAMNSVKARSKNNFGIYKNHMSDDIMDAAILKKDLKEAVRDSQFRLYYHPQVDLVSNEIVSLEVLTRWEHPERGLIYPNDFIPLAEESRLIIPMGDFILRTACEQLKRWHDEGFPKYSISVNISPIQLQQHHFIDKVEDILNDTGLAPHYIEMEITEDSLIRYMEQAIDTLNQLHDMGVKIALDDFGTGYSSLNYLKNLPVDIIKMDKAFIDNIENEIERAITKAIIELGHDMDLHITAEGVETKEQFNFLRDQGCDRAQGFLFCKPLPKVQVPKKIYRIHQQMRVL